MAQKKTLKDIAEEIKQKFFKDVSLLNLSKANNLDDCFEAIERFAKYAADDLSTHQLRNVYGKVKSSKDIRELKMLRPNLAYVAARQKKKSNAKNVIAFIDSLIKNVNDDVKVENFKTFMESLVAYHKYYYEK